MNDNTVALFHRSKCKLKNRINELIEESYEVFGKYKLKAPIENSWDKDEYFLTGGKADEEFFRDLERPLADVSNRSILAISAEGQMLQRLEDFKYFLPRVLTLIARGTYPDNAFRTMTLSQFDTWSDDEISFIVTFTREVFESVLDGDHGGASDFVIAEEIRGDDAVLDFLEAAACVVSVEELLDRWHLRKDANAMRLLVKSALKTAEHIDILIDFDCYDGGISIRIAEFLLNSHSVSKILRDAQLSKELGFIDTSIDLEKLKTARKQLAKSRIKNAHQTQ